MGGCRLGNGHARGNRGPFPCVHLAKQGSGMELISSIYVVFPHSAYSLELMKGHYEIEICHSLKRNR